MFLAFSCIAFGADFSNTQDAALNEIVAAPTPSSFRSLQADAAAIKSPEDLVAYLGAFSGQRSAFAPLSDAGRIEFIQHLRFSEKGLASFSRNVLENELTPTQIHKILALFGLQGLTGMLSGARIQTPLDQYLLKDRSRNKQFGYDDAWQGYACSGRATCSKSFDDVCTDNC